MRGRVAHEMTDLYPKPAWNKHFFCVAELRDAVLDEILTAGQSISASAKRTFGDQQVDNGIACDQMTVNDPVEVFATGPAVPISAGIDQCDRPLTAHSEAASLGAQDGALHVDEARIARIDARIQSRLATIGAEESVQMHCTAPEVSTAAVTDPAFRAAIHAAADAAGLGAMELPSGAGHDAQNVATFAPMGMIFVPSVGGISHSPKEYTTPVAVARGTDVLGRALLGLDGSL